MRRALIQFIVAACIAVTCFSRPMSAAIVECVETISITENGGTPPWVMYKQGLPPLPQGYTLDPDGRHVDIPPERAAAYWPSGERPGKGSCSVALLRGPIKAGDYEMTRKFVRQHLPFLEAMLLHSPGGRVDEAIKIGRLLRQYLINTSAPDRFRENNLRYINTELCRGPGCICASACALIWFGGPSRDGRVGLHRPHFKDQAFARLPASEANKAYNAMLNLVTQYMTEMNVPRHAIDAMTATPSNEMIWVEASQVGTDRSLSRDPSYHEWVLSSCPSLLNAEELLKFIAGVGGPNTPEGDGLAKRYLQAGLCERTLRHNNRDKLAKP